MATVIDALIVQLGLDAKAVVKGQKQAEGAFKRVQSGASKMGDGVAAAADTAGDAFHSLERKALAFFAVLTAGKTLKAFISDTTSANVAAGNMARNLGVSVNSLTAWQKAAQAAGGSAEDVSGSIGSLVSQFQTIDGHQNLGHVFGQMGVQLEGANGQIRDMNDLMPDLARAAQRLGPQMFSALGSQAGFSQGFINLLEQGPDHIQKLYKSLQKYAPTERDTRESAKLLESWTLLTAQSEAFGRSIMTDLSPEVRELMDLFSGFVRSHSDAWLANIKTGADQLTASIKSVNWQKIGEEIKVWWDYIKAIDWAKVSQEIKSFGQAADGAAQFVGGWAEAVKLLFDLWVGAKFASMLRNVQLLAAATGVGASGLTTMLAAAGIGYAAHKGIEAADPKDQTGRWIDNNIPGAAILDNLASKAGLGRSYAEQDAASATPEGVADRQKILSHLDARYGFPSGTMDALWAQESSRGKNAKDSSAGAQGDFQIMPNVAKEAGIDPHNWRQSAYYAAQRLYGDQQKFGSLAASIAAYNAGAGRVSSLQKQYGGQWLSHAPQETQNYVDSIGKAVGQASAMPQTSMTTSSNTVNNNNFTINAPGGDPRQIRKAVDTALNSPRMMARQSNLGLA